MFGLCGVVALMLSIRLIGYCDALSRDGRRAGMRSRDVRRKWSHKLRMSLSVSCSVPGKTNQNRIGVRKMVWEQSRRGWEVASEALDDAIGCHVRVQLGEKAGWRLD
jgi:hypothetical protein